MSSAIAALEAAGLVNGTPDPEDGRQTIMSLTEACRDWIRVGRAARQDWLTRTITARLSPREQGELAAAVGLMKRLIDD
jgi:DNA-binding MarR family transcriptional regulator